MGVYNPVYATYRLEHTEKHLVSRVLAAWSVSSSLTIAALTALWGVLASLTSPRIAIAVAGVLLLTTPLPAAAPRAVLSRPLPRPHGLASQVDGKIFGTYRAGKIFCTAGQGTAAGSATYAVVRT